MTNTLTIPGPVDPHVHLRGMGWSHKGTFASETSAAVAGGYWAVLDMPNTPPVTVERSALQRKLADMATQAVCDWGAYFCAAASGNWDEYASTFKDVCGVKMFNNSTTGNLLVEDPSVREQHYSRWPGGKVFANHAEDGTLADILELLKKYRKPTHILHVSTAREVALIAKAKADGLPVTAGVCPHHLWLTEEDIPRLGGLGMMKPSLKTRTDQAALWDALVDGTIDVVESDHAPHTLEEKESDPAPFGVPGLETSLPLMCTAVHEGRLTVERVIELVATNPRRIFGLTCPQGTYTVIELDTSYVIDRRNLHTQCGWSPFEGMRVHGRVRETWIRGQQVFDGERIMVDPGYGVNLYG